MFRTEHSIRNPLSSLEACAISDGRLQHFHPALKIACALCYSICVTSCHRYHLYALVPFILLLTGLFIISRIPVRVYLSRLWIALPFSFFAGIWGCFYDTAAVVTIAGFGISGGLISLISIVLRSILCVGIILILAGTTPVRAFSDGLRMFRTPIELVLVFELIWRYLGILFDEVSRMMIAWRLRGGTHRGIAIKHYGSFCGGLFLRSMDRASRVYHAMVSRGYPPVHVRQCRMPVFREWCGAFLFILLCIIFRFFF